MNPLPARIETEAALDDVMTTPSESLIDAARQWRGDLLILGVAGKMGPTLARLAQRAIEAAGSNVRVIGVARFSKPDTRQALHDCQIQTIVADLLDESALAALPDAPNVIHMAAHKFGSTGNPGLTWAMNTYLAARVAQRFSASRIVALSTGNIYPFWPADSAGPAERDAVGPVGEYAQSCLGRERMFEYMSERNGTPVAMIRLNYAIDLRYGVLLDLAQKVFKGEPIDLAMGYVNVIWQGDANEVVLRCLDRTASPPFILNVTGGERLSVRELGNSLGQRLGKTPVFVGTEAPTALLSNALRCRELMGEPRVPLDRMLDWIAYWVQIGGSTLAKPTHFQARDGKF